MTIMKLFLYLLFLPLPVFSQSVHVVDKEIKYEGRGRTQVDVPETDIFNQVQQALQKSVNGNLEVQQDTGIVTARGLFRLNSPYYLIRTVHYRIQINPIAEGYHYIIDSIYLVEQKRGGEKKLLSSKELVESMKETGNSLIRAEKTLNEIDMRLQKILAVFRSKMEEDKAESL